VKKPVLAESGGDTLSHTSSKSYWDKGTKDYFRVRESMGSDCRVGPRVLGTEDLVLQI